MNPIEWFQTKHRERVRSEKDRVHRAIIIFESTVRDCFDDETAQRIIDKSQTLKMFKRKEEGLEIKLYRGKPQPKVEPPTP